VSGVRGVEWSGVEWSGAEWNGGREVQWRDEMKWSGLQWSMDWSVMEEVEWSDEAWRGLGVGGEGRATCRGCVVERRRAAREDLRHPHFLGGGVEANKEALQRPLRQTTATAHPRNPQKNVVFQRSAQGSYTGERTENA
jgi:hypothetical protein